MIVHPPVLHPVESRSHHFEHGRIANPGVVPEEQADSGRRRKFRSDPEPTEARIELVRELAHRALQMIGADRCGSPERALVLHVLYELTGLGLYAVPLAFPRLGDAREQRGKSRTSVGVARGKVGARKERLLIGRQKHRHRPAATAAHGNGGCHVDLIQIRPLFAIDFDAHEAVVHELRDGRILEALALHHVAPMARCVSNAEEDGSVVGFRPLQGLGAPRIPVDGVF